MTTDDPRAEWLRCEPLPLRQLQGLLTEGVPSYAIAGSTYGDGYHVVRDRVRADRKARRFEFGRYGVGGPGEWAIIVVAQDRDGEAADLVAYRGGDDGFLCSWLGRAPMLGAECLDDPSRPDPLPIHGDVMTWLRAGRVGVVPIDLTIAGPILRDCGPFSVDTPDDRARILAAMRPTFPEITVARRQRAEAA